MIVGLGVDILRVSRMKRVHGRHGERLADRVLHARERPGYEEARHQDAYLAKCFAVKEAFVKALGTGFVGVAHDDVGVVRGARGEPRLVFSRSLRQKLTRRRIRRAHVTLSDEGGLVCAVVVLER